MKNKKIAKEWGNIIFLMATCVFVTLFLLYQIVQQTSESVKKEKTEHIVEIAEQVGNNVDVRTKVTWDMIQNVEEMLGIAEGVSEDSVSGYLQYEKSLWEYKNMFLMSDDFAYYNEDEKFNKFTVDENLYERMLRGEYINIVAAWSGKEDSIYYMRTVKPVKYKNITVSSIGISFRMDALAREIGISTLENEGRCYLINPKEQTIVYSSNKEFASNDDVENLLGNVIGEKHQKSVNHIKESVLQRKKEAVFLDTQEGKSYVISVPMKENNWVLLAVIPEAKISDNMNGFMVKIMFSSLAIMIIMITVCIYMCKLYGKRIEQKKGEETLQYLEQALKAAQHSEKVKSRFILSLSHDIRTPMNGIMGMSMLAKANLQNQEKVENCLNKIDAQANHLVQLVNDVLDISQMENEKFRLNNNKICLMDVLNEVIDLTRIQVEEKHQNFQVDISAELSTEVWGDAIGIKKILLNVLSNAVKYTKEGGNIIFRANVVKCSRKFLNVLFVIQDNGKGMEKAYVNRIFDAFSREEQDEVKVIEGNGLGMAITKQLVEAMNGFICVESELGEGSRFSIKLPFKRGFEEETKIEEAQEETSDFTYQYKKILLAEDNALNAEIMKEILIMAGASVEIAPNGKAAVEAFEASFENYYDYILMDIQMPVMDGYSAARTIRSLERADAKKIIILAMTAHAFLQDIEKAKEAGMDGHVSKPIDMKILSGKLEELESKR